MIGFFTVSTFSHDKQLMSDYKDYILGKENQNSLVTKSASEEYFKDFS